MVRSSRPSRATWVAVSWGLSIVLAAGVGLVAGRAVFVPPQTVDEVVTTRTYTVGLGTVGASTRYTAVAEWPTEPLVTGAAGGTVTEVLVEPGEEVSSGDVLYSVDLRPVVVAEGTVPAFRDLQAGDRGADVTQLQQMLVDLGHLNAEPDGVHGAATTAAVRRWQADVGVARTGVVQQGDVVFAATLPARVVLAEEVEVGTRIEPGTTVASVVADVPEVSIPLGQDQRADGALTGTPVTVEAEDHAWNGMVAEVVTTDTGESSLTLTGPDGGPVCGTDCVDLPFTVDALRLAATVVTEPEVEGPIVPVSALRTGPDGAVSVRTEAGGAVPVMVVGSDGAHAVVEGLDVGAVILLHGEDDATTGEPSPGDRATAL